MVCLVRETNGEEGYFYMTSAMIKHKPVIGAGTLNSEKLSTLKTHCPHHFSTIKFLWVPIILKFEISSKGAREHVSGTWRIEVGRLTIHDSSSDSSAHQWEAKEWSVATRCSHLHLRTYLLFSAPSANPNPTQLKLLRFSLSPSHICSPPPNSPTCRQLETLLQS